MAHLLIVETYSPAGFRVSRETIDHDNAERRAWLGRHCFWAFRNDHAVLTFPPGIPTRPDISILAELASALTELHDAAVAAGVVLPGSDVAEKVKTALRESGATHGSESGGC